MQPARKRLEVDERREQLLTIALEMFANKTYDEISIDEIAKAAGISKGLLYHYFPSKRAFYVASIRRSAEELLSQADPGDDLPPGPERLRRGLHAFLTYVSTRGRAYSSLMRGGVGCDPEVREIIDASRTRFIARVFERFADRASDPRVETMLQGWLGFVEGTTLHWVEAQEVELDELCDLLVKASLGLFQSLMANTAK